MKIDNPKFKNHIYWYEWPVEIRNEISLRKKILELAPHEIVIPFTHKSDYKDLGDIGELTEGKWTAFSDTGYIHYFFELEFDAVAFKLRWL